MVLLANAVAGSEVEAPGGAEEPATSGEFCNGTSWLPQEAGFEQTESVAVYLVFCTGIREEYVALWRECNGIREFQPEGDCPAAEGSISTMCPAIYGHPSTYPVGEATSAACSQTQSATRCTTTNTVCVDAFAKAKVVCTTSWGYNKCVPTITPGGFAFSPLKLRGNLAWSGQACAGKNFGNCGSPRSGGGVCSWDGSDAKWGCEDTSTWAWDGWGCFLCKARAYVQGSSTAEGLAYLPGGNHDSIRSSASGWDYQTRG